MLKTEGAIPPARSKKRVASGAFLYVSLAFLQRGVSFLILPFVTRVLSPADYGAISIVTFTSTLIGVLLGAALEPAVLRWSVRPEIESARILWICQRHFYFIVPAISILVAFVLYLLEFELLGVSSRIWSVEIVAAGLLASVAYFSTPLIRARDQLMRFSIVSTVGIVLTVGGKIWFVIINEWGVFGWVLSDLIAGSATFLVGASLAKVSRKGMWRAEGVLARFSVPLLPGRIATWSLTSLSRPALAMVATQYSVGIFSLAMNIAAVSTMFIGEVNRSFVVEYSRESIPGPTSRTRDYARLQLLLSFVLPACIGVGIWFFGPILIDSAFHAAFPLIGILLLGQAAYGVFIVPNNYVVQTSGRTKWSWVGSFVGAVTMVLGIAVFGGSGGEYAASVVTVTGYLVMAVSAFVLVKALGLTILWSRIALPAWSWAFCVLCLSLSCASLFFISEALGLIFAMGSLVLVALTLVAETRGGGCLARGRRGSLERVLPSS